MAYYITEVLEHDVLEYYASDVIIITTPLPSTLVYDQWELVKYIIKTSSGQTRMMSTLHRQRLYLSVLDEPQAILAVAFSL